MAGKRKKEQEGLWIGCSGFSYDDWRDGAFYPPGLPQAEWLEFYAGKFSTVELNITFYRLPQEAAFQGWRKRTPDGFRFALKGSRYITHRLKLVNVEEPLNRLLERAALLGDKLGPLLWQLPPSFHKDREKLAGFIDLLLKHTSVAQAFEFRHPSWFADDVYELLHKHGMTVCMADWPRNLPQVPDDFKLIYVRRHGTGPELFHGSYSDEQLEYLARLIRRWRAAGKEVYVYFNNDFEAQAPHNALTLLKLARDRGT